MNKLKSLFNNFSKSILPIIGLTVFISMAFIMYYWETVGRENYLYQSVLVFKEDITAGTLIADDNLLTYQRVEFDNLIDNAITDKTLIVGMAATHFIPKGSQIHPSFLEEKELILKPGQYVFKIPNEWIYSLPDSLRRKDHITLYEIGVNGTFVNDNKDSTNGDINTYANEQASSVKSFAGNILFDTVTVYVKDSNNREVVTTSNYDRFDGSSKINAIEVIGTIDQIKKITDSADKGNKFLIMYSGGN